MSNPRPKEALTKGHRQRLRQRLIDDPVSFSEADYLELLLTYAIPRLDVRPLAINLLAQFGSLGGVFSAPATALAEVPGLGEQSITYLKLMENICMTINRENQPMLFQDMPTLKTKKTNLRPKRGFTDDETKNSIQFLPKVIEFSTLELIKSYLRDNLPYNSEVTRTRRMKYIMDRFFPDDSLDLPMIYFLSHSKSSKALESLVFFEIMKTEPLPQKIAEDLIYPNLPLGFVRRGQIEEFIRTNEPDLLTASVSKAISAVIHLYSESRTALFKENRLIINLHTSDIDGFLYVITSVFNQPGIYSYEDLIMSPVHRWMLWDKDWMIRQLYNLRDMGIISKISEIDQINQFTISMTQTEALNFYFSNPSKSEKAIRDNGNPINNYEVSP